MKCILPIISIGTPLLAQNLPVFPVYLESPTIMIVGMGAFH